MTLVLDSSALFSMENLPEDHVCPPGVVKELRKYIGEYIDFISGAKTERLAHDMALEMAKAAGLTARARAERKCPVECPRSSPSGASQP